MRRLRNTLRSCSLCFCLAVVALSSSACLGFLPAQVIGVVMASRGVVRIEVEEHITLKAIVAGVGDYDYTVTWSSSNEDVAEVDPATGEVSGMEPGTATITAISNGDNTKRASLEITVSEKSEVLEITVSAPTDTIEVNDEITLSARVEITGDAEETVRWRSLDPEIATVEADTGKVKGVGVGSVTIAAVSIADITVFGHIGLTVLEEATITGVIITPAARTIERGEEFTLVAEVEGTGRYDRTVTWSSSDVQTAEVDPATGKVTGLRIGADPVTITAVANGSGEISATAEITVVKPKAARIEIGWGDGPVSMGFREWLSLSATAWDARGATIDDAELVWSLEEDNTEGTEIDPDTGSVTSGEKEVVLTVVVKDNIGGEGTDSITVFVGARPFLLTLNFENSNSDEGLLFRGRDTLQRNLPYESSTLEIEIPPSYEGFDPARCTPVFTTTEGSKVVLRDGGGEVTSGVTVLDVTHPLVLVVSKGALQRAYTISVSTTDYYFVPDNSFRAALKELVGDAFSGEFLITRHQKVVECDRLRIVGRRIRSLAGIEFFTGLTYLDCTFNPISELDISQNMALRTLNCLSTSLTKLDLSSNTNLEILRCDTNDLKGLDLSNNTMLKELSCINAGLDELDVSNNTLLERLYCSGNNLQKLDPGRNIALKRLFVRDNNLSRLDLSANINLTTLSCNNNRMAYLDMSGVRSMSNSDVLYLQNNPYGTLVVHKNMADHASVEEIIQVEGLEGRRVDGDIYTYRR